LRPFSHRPEDRFEWTSRGTLAALVVWACLLVAGVVLYVLGDREPGVVVAMVGFFAAPFVMVLGGRTR